MSSKKSTIDKNRQFLNKKATYEYEILERFEAGISLQGSEIKAIRQARVNLKECYVKVLNGQVYIINMQITHLSTANKYNRPSETRDRKLLLHKKQIKKLHDKVAKDGMSIVVLKLYLNDRNLIKATIAIARGKKLHDKREALKQKTLKRESQMLMKDMNYKK
ncbi:MAG: SsrA-binding protein [Epsilonproteobacteria bacterium]|nr:MAG: SsrA-binding protein [Campylobacterota bacterium]